MPLKNASASGYVGDMPHNWASAECVLYLRHMLALEDRRSLRLIEGISNVELASRQPWVIEKSPTRFGRVSLSLEPEGRGWLLRFRREGGPPPDRLTLPSRACGPRFAGVQGAASKVSAAMIEVDPGASSWTARWS